MKTFTSTDVAKKFGAIADIARREPVLVESHGRPQVVMLSPQQYERLRRQDRLVLTARELPPSLRAAIAAAQPSARAADYNDEV
jgi:PHD/YefM family antitoxin component YafN of YafNO toxin-antitoxin module